MSLDTLRIARELRDADLAPEQAEAIATAIGSAVGEGSASKADLEALAQRLEGKFEALKADTKSLEERLIAKIEFSEERLAGKIESSRAWLLAWFISIFIAAIGLAFAALKVL